MMKSEVADVAGGALAWRETETTGGNIRLGARVGDVPGSVRGKCRKGKQHSIMGSA